MRTALCSQPPFCVHIMCVRLHISVYATSGTAGLWAEVLAALRGREAGALLDELEEGAEEVQVAAVVSYHYQRARCVL